MTSCLCKSFNGVAFHWKPISKHAMADVECLLGLNFDPIDDIHDNTSNRLTDCKD